MHRVQRSTKRQQTTTIDAGTPRSAGVDMINPRTLPPPMDPSVADVMPERTGIEMDDRRHSDGCQRVPRVGCVL